METVSSSPLYTTLRIVGFVVLALIVVAIGYATYISIANWNAIRV